MAQLPDPALPLAGAGSSGGLDRHLDLAGEDFDLTRLLGEGGRADTVVQYFTQSLPAYFLCHSPRGSMHMALNRDGVFDRGGYDEQSRLVECHIRDTGAQRILEMGCGKGYNLRCLSRRNPELQFFGVDLTPWHVRVARLRGMRLRNLQVREGNFEQLPFPDNSFDLVFSVEAICHAADGVRVAREARRVLRPGGRFVTIEPWRCSGFGDLDAQRQRAARLVEVGFVLPALQEADHWQDEALALGFEVVETEDLNEAVLPNMLRLRERALRVRGVSWGRSRLHRRFPHMMGNALAALLLPETFGGGTPGGGHCYRLIALACPQEG